MGFERYQLELKSLGSREGKSFKIIGGQLPYLTQHAAFMRVHTARRFDKVVMHSSSQGPLWFATQYNASETAAVLGSMHRDDCALRDVPFLKIPHPERQEIVRL